MSSIDPTTVDVAAVMLKIQQVERGELPEDAVSIEELRAAIEAQRRGYQTEATEAAPKKASSKKAASNLSFDFSNLLAGEG